MLTDCEFLVAGAVQNRSNRSEARLIASFLPQHSCQLAIRWEDRRSRALPVPLARPADRSVPQPPHVLHLAAFAARCFFLLRS